MRNVVVYLCLVMMLACAAQESDIVTGAQQMERYLPLLEGKSIAIVSNHTSLVGNTHLVDTLFSIADEHFEIMRVFAPEHGFRGKADAGAELGDEFDFKTGIQIISLYGKNKKPTAEQLKGIDVLIFDIQDIGVRFYTYISTLHYVMEACAENEIKLLVLDRPNPNGAYVDGPVLKQEYRSFVGMHEIPVVHGLSIGELALMIRGEGWLSVELPLGSSEKLLDNGQQEILDLMVIPCLNYSHTMSYSLPVKPSPNLPNDHSIRIYPSTCFFEGTVISEGRGTFNPFELYGHPKLSGPFSFTPESIPGMSMYPKLKGQLCFGEDLRDFIPEGGWQGLELRWIIDAYSKYPDKQNFFIPFFDKLAGSSALREMIQEGWNEEDIRASWQEELDIYMEMRNEYLLY